MANPCDGRIKYHHAYRLSVCSVVDVTQGNEMSASIANVLFNDTLESIPQSFLYFEREWHLYNICIPLVAFCGLTFNVFFIRVVHHTPYMQTVTNHYLLSFGVCRHTVCMSKHSSVDTFLQFVIK